MQARCSWCGQVQIARDGTWVEVFLSSPGTGVASTHVFRCSLCVHTESKGRVVGTGIVAVQRRARPPAGTVDDVAKSDAGAATGETAARTESPERAQPAAEAGAPVEATGAADEIAIREEPEPEVPDMPPIEPVPEMAGAGTTTS